MLSQLLMSWKPLGGQAQDNNRLQVVKRGKDFADCTVLAGGTISDRKGVNVPDVVLPLAALSEKDRDDLEFACRCQRVGRLLASQQL